MNDDPPSEARTATFQAHRGLRLLALATVILGVLALATAAFVFSYSGVRHMALAAGVPTGLARFYPALPDAVLVVACAAALMLRDAKWWTRWLAWLSIILVAAAVGTADAVYAMAIKVPHRLLAAIIAVVPWLLLLLGFRLWLSVLRYPRRETVIAAADAATVAAPAAAAVPDALTEEAAELVASAGEPAEGATPEPLGGEAPAGEPVQTPAGEPVQTPAGEPVQTPAGEAELVPVGGPPTPSAAGEAAAESWDSGELWDGDAVDADADSRDADHGASSETALTGLDLILGPRPEEPASRPSAPPLSAPVPEEPQPAAGEAAEPEAAEAESRGQDTAEPDSVEPDTVPAPVPGRDRSQQPPSPDFHRVRSSPVRPRE